MSKGTWLESVADEFQNARLPDLRLASRVHQAMEALTAKPDCSFPTAMGSPKELGGLYRLLNNTRVNYEQLFEAHARQTAARVRSAGECLVVHDTSIFRTPHLAPEEIGEFSKGKAGFLGHFSLVLDGDLSRCPLGVVAMQTIHRDPGREKKPGRLTGAQCAALPDRESERWLRGVVLAEHQLGGRVVHVMDREGDSYALYDQLLRRASRFVIRCDDRTCLFEGDTTYVREALSRQQIVVEREVDIARRKRAAIAHDSERTDEDDRPARLAIAGCRIALKRTKFLKAPVASSIEVNVVHVFELDPPGWAEPIDWLIFTTEPIDTSEQLQRVVDIYRCRWVIEEFFKAIKTGCSYEQRQLQERESLLMALVLFLPIACQLLWLRSRARVQPEASVEGFVDPLQLKIVRRFSDFKLSSQPTLLALVWAIASMGGHQKSNGDPGWQTLSRGWRRVLELEEGWRAALDSS